MIDHAASAHRPVVDRLGAVAVRVEQKRAVVVLRVLRPRPGWAVVPIAGRGAGPPEVVDVRTRGRHEPDVEVPRGRLLRVGRRQREVVPLGEGLARVASLDSDRAEHGLVEALRRLTVRGANRHVVEHGDEFPGSGRY